MNKRRVYIYWAVHTQWLEKRLEENGIGNIYLRLPGEFIYSTARWTISKLYFIHGSLILYFQSGSGFAFGKIFP